MNNITGTTSGCALNFNEILQSIEKFLPRISKLDLCIPESLNKFYLENGWNDDYWKELPIDWNQWSDDRLKKYPMTKVIYLWKRNEKLQVFNNPRGVKE